MGPKQRTGSSKSPPRSKKGTASPSPGLKSLYAPIFEDFDTDKSGFIDASELYKAVCLLFPGTGFTAADIASMLEEADLNRDGVISLEEFASIMTAAEGKSTMWGQAQKSIWSQFSRNVQQATMALYNAASPLRTFGRQNSYECPDTGARLATVGLRALCLAAEYLLLGVVLVLILQSQSSVKWKEGEGDNSQ